MKIEEQGVCKLESNCIQTTSSRHWGKDGRKTYERNLSKLFLIHIHWIVRIAFRERVACLTTAWSLRMVGRSHALSRTVTLAGESCFPWRMTFGTWSGSFQQLSEPCEYSCNESEKVSGASLLLAWELGLQVSDPSCHSSNKIWYLWHQMISPC